MFFQINYSECLESKLGQSLVFIKTPALYLCSSKPKVLNVIWFMDKISKFKFINYIQQDRKFRSYLSNFSAFGAWQPDASTVVTFRP